MICEAKTGKSWEVWYQVYKGGGGGLPKYKAFMISEYQTAENH